jgi:hypothetical protein
VAVAVGVMVAGAGVGVSVDAASGPEVSVGVGSGVELGAGSMGLLMMKTPAMSKRIIAEMVTLRLYRVRACSCSSLKSDRAPSRRARSARRRKKSRMIPKTRYISHW